MHKRETQEFQLDKKLCLGSSKQSLIDHVGIGGIAGFVLALLLLYFLLLGHDHDTIFSLSHLLNWTEHLSSIGEQLLVILMLPIYLAILIFGGALLGIISGIYLQRIIEGFVLCRNFFKKL